MSNTRANLNEKRVTAKRATRKRVKVSERPIVTISGKGVRKSCLIVRIPTVSALCVLICLLILASALVLSPDIAAQFAFAVIQLARLTSQPTK